MSRNINYTTQAGNALQGSITTEEFKTIERSIDRLISTFSSTRDSSWYSELTEAAQRNPNVMSVVIKEGILDGCSLLFLYLFDDMYYLFKHGNFGNNKPPSIDLLAPAILDLDILTQIPTNKELFGKKCAFLLLLLAPCLDLMTSLLANKTHKSKFLNLFLTATSDDKNRLFTAFTTHIYLVDESVSAARLFLAHSHNQHLNKALLNHPNFAESQFTQTLLHFIQKNITPSEQEKIYSFLDLDPSAADIIGSRIEISQQNILFLYNALEVGQLITPEFTLRYPPTVYHENDSYYITFHAENETQLRLLAIACSQTLHCMNLRDNPEAMVTANNGYASTYELIVKKEGDFVIPIIHPNNDSNMKTIRSHHQFKLYTQMITHINSATEHFITNLYRITSACKLTTTKNFASHHITITMDSDTHVDVSIEGATVTLTTYDILSWLNSFLLMSIPKHLQCTINHDTLSITVLPSVLDEKINIQSNPSLLISALKSVHIPKEIELISDTAINEKLTAINHMTLFLTVSCQRLKLEETTNDDVFLNYFKSCPTSDDFYDCSDLDLLMSAPNEQQDTAALDNLALLKERIKSHETINKALPEIANKLKSIISDFKNASSGKKSELQARFAELKQTIETNALILTRDDMLAKINSLDHALYDLTIDLMTAAFTAIPSKFIIILDTILSNIRAMKNESLQKEFIELKSKKETILSNKKNKRLLETLKKSTATKAVVATNQIKPTHNAIEKVSVITTHEDLLRAVAECKKTNNKDLYDLIIAYKTKEDEQLLEEHVTKIIAPAKKTVSTPSSSPAATPQTNIKEILLLPLSKIPLVFETTTLQGVKTCKNLIDTQAHGTDERSQHYFSWLITQLNTLMKISHAENTPDQHITRLFNSYGIFIALLSLVGEVNLCSDSLEGHEDAIANYHAAQRTLKIISSNEAHKKLFIAIENIFGKQKLAETEQEFRASYTDLQEDCHHGAVFINQLTKAAVKESDSIHNVLDNKRQSVRDFLSIFNIMSSDEPKNMTLQKYANEHDVVNHLHNAFKQRINLFTLICTTLSHTESTTQNFGVYFTLTIVMRDIKRMLNYFSFFDFCQQNAGRTLDQKKLHNAIAENGNYMDLRVVFNTILPLDKATDFANFFRHFPGNVGKMRLDQTTEALIAEKMATLFLK